MTVSSNALSVRSFRVFTASYICFFCGWWLQRVTLAWSVWASSPSPFWLGFMGFAEIVPLLLITPLSGMLADRIDRVRIMRWCQLLAVTVSLVLMAFSLCFRITPWLGVLMFAARGAINALFLPAALAVVPNLVEKHQLNSAIGINSVVANISVAIGPTLAGLMLLYCSANVAYGLSIVLHLVCCGLLFALPRENPPPNPVRLSGMFAGHTYAFHHPTIRTMLLMYLVATLGGRALIDLMPAFASLVPQAGLKFLSFFFAAFGSGAAIGSLWMSIVSANKGTAVRGYISAALFTMIIAAAVLAAAPSYLISIPAVFVLGFTVAINGIGTQVVIQSEAADALRGRVMALYSLIFRAGWAFGAFAIGAAASVIGLRSAGIASALICFCAWIATELTHLPAVARSSEH